MDKRADTGKNNIFPRPSEIFDLSTGTFTMWKQLIPPVLANFALSPFLLYCFFLSLLQIYRSNDTHFRRPTLPLPFPTLFQFYFIYCCQKVKIKGGIRGEREKNSGLGIWSHDSKKLGRQFLGWKPPILFNWPNHQGLGLLFTATWSFTPRVTTDWTNNLYSAY